MYKIGNGMLFFGIKNWYWQFFSISKAGIGKVEMFKIGFAYLHTQSYGKQKYILMFESIGPCELNPISKEKYILSNLSKYFCFLTEWWRMHSNVLA